MAETNEAMGPMEHDAPIANGELGPIDRTRRPGDLDVNHFVAVVQDRARLAADYIAVQMQEHPVRTLAIAGALGFIVASSMRYRIVPALLRSGAGLAAAIAMRELAERGLRQLDVD